MIHWVRHGQSTWNAIHKMQGHALHPALTELGRAQARSAAAELARVGASRLVTSPAKRAHQTADVIAGHTGLSVEVDARLLEKGLDEHTENVAGRLADFLLSTDSSDWIVVSHGDVIALACARAGLGTDIPGNGSVTAI